MLNSCIFAATNARNFFDPRKRVAQSSVSSTANAAAPTDFIFCNAKKNSICLRLNTNGFPSAVNAVTNTLLPIMRAWVASEASDRERLLLSCAIADRVSKGDQPHSHPPVASGLETKLKKARRNNRKQLSLRA